MDEYGYSQEHQPLTWWRGHAIYVAHVLVLVWVASMLVTTVLMWAGAHGVLGLLPFSSQRVLAGEAWRILSYGFYNPPSLWFVVEMAMIIWFGREVERFFGRKIFLEFYLGLYLFLPLLFTAIGLWRPVALPGESGAFGLFLAFATLHPSVPVFFNLQARHVAFVLVGIYTLIGFSRNDVNSLLALWATVGFSYAFVRHEQGHFTLPKLRWPSRQPKLRVLPGGDRRGGTARSSSDPAMAELDALLDKIARSGLGSLTAQERSKLDQGREALRRRSSGH